MGGVLQVQIFEEKGPELEDLGIKAVFLWVVVEIHKMVFAEGEKDFFHRALVDACSTAYFF